MFTECAVSPSSLLREEVYLVCSGPFISLERGGSLNVQWAPHPSWEMRFTWCAVGPSSLLREVVYLVYSGPFIPLERGCLPSVQWAPHPSCQMKFAKCAASPSSLPRMRYSQFAVGPSSLLREEVYLVCSGPFISLERGGLPNMQWAPHPSWEMRVT